MAKQTIQASVWNCISRSDNSVTATVVKLLEQRAWELVTCVSARVGCVRRSILRGAVLFFFATICCVSIWNLKTGRCVAVLDPRQA